jgi:hypothetical protein
LRIKSFRFPDGSLSRSYTYCDCSKSGIGTLWEQQGVAGADTANCPYKGVNANREYRAISGCSVVPIELDGGTGTRCGHWDDFCLRTELLTGYLGGGVKNPLSKITIGSLQDLGYSVSYAAADAYTAANLDPSCLCRRRDRSILEMLHGDTLQLGLRSPDTRPRRLSAEMLKVAIDYGRSVLAKRRNPLIVDQFLSLQSNDVQAAFVGDQVVSVMVRDGEGLFSVVVRNEH